MRISPSAGSRCRSGPGRLRYGCRPGAPGIPAALRGRSRQRPLESWAIPCGPRLRPAPERLGDRGLASALVRRSAERYGGGGDDPSDPSDPERHPRRHGPSFPIPPDHERHAEGGAVVTPISITINGKPHGPLEVRDELTMNDFLREYLGLTGTKFGCGAAQCLSCAVIVDEPDGTSRTSPTCIVPAVSFAGKSVRTIESHAKDGELSPLQKAFVEHFAFQCGYCTPGFVNEGQVLLERLSKAPIPRTELDSTILEALDGHLCRCTGYVKYHEAVRAVILADPSRYLT